jgi:hypothetical protein
MKHSLFGLVHPKSEGHQCFRNFSIRNDLFTTVKTNLFEVTPSLQSLPRIFPFSIGSRVREELPVRRRRWMMMI